MGWNDPIRWRYGEYSGEEGRLVLSNVWFSFPHVVEDPSQVVVYSKRFRCKENDDRQLRFEQVVLRFRVRHKLHVDVVFLTNNVLYDFCISRTLHHVYTMEQARHWLKALAPTFEPAVQGVVHQLHTLTPEQQLCVGEMVDQDVFAVFE